MNEPYTFDVLSTSSSSQYTVSVWVEAEQVLCVCDCSAGRFGKLCKHKVAILSGDKNALSQLSQISQLESLYEKVVKTSTGKCLSELEVAETEFQQAKKDLERLKKQLEQMIRE